VVNGEWNKADRSQVVMYYAADLEENTNIFSSPDMTTNTRVSASDALSDLQSGKIIYLAVVDIDPSVEANAMWKVFSLSRWGIIESPVLTFSSVWVETGFTTGVFGISVEVQDLDGLGYLSIASTATNVH